MDEGEGGHSCRVFSGVGVHRTIEIRQWYVSVRLPGPTEMQGPTCSGFDWNDDEKCTIAKKEVFDNCVRSHPATKRLFNKLFPYYDELAYVFDHDKTTGRFVKTFVDVGSNEPTEYKGFDMSDGNEEFLSLYNQGTDMSQKDVRALRPAHTSDGRVGLSRSKRKRGSQRESELEVINMVLECTNDQLRMIAEWPAYALANDTHVHQEFLHLLHEIP
ncbi:retrotransposon protein [Cucumis melo var. makuwa]|uniref:Retrotransposon protein n=1 Tax=Cucumis melo var. makuwa TaxID=1194695 RepID=A0A5D3DAC5_CUCMM|nr:retrotransposon protein [Cucumis melo var. makuwa]